MATPGRRELQGLSAESSVNQRARNRPTDREGAAACGPAVKPNREFGIASYGVSSRMMGRRNWSVLFQCRSISAAYQGGPFFDAVLTEFLLA